MGIYVTLNLIIKALSDHNRLSLRSFVHMFTCLTGRLLIIQLVLTLRLATYTLNYQVSSCTLGGDIIEFIPCSFHDFHFTYREFNSFHGHVTLNPDDNIRNELWDGVRGFLRFRFRFLFDWIFGLCLVAIAAICFLLYVNMQNDLYFKCIR